MQLPKLYIFVSSTWEDLQPERSALIDSLNDLNSSIPIEVVCMEKFGSRHENTLNTSLNEVSNSHIYVGIIGGRYSSGTTEEEYKKARELRMRCFIYFKKVRHEPLDRARLIAFKKRLKLNHTYSWFTKPDELAKKF